MLRVMKFIFHWQDWKRTNTFEKPKCPWRREEGSMFKYYRKKLFEGKISIAAKAPKFSKVPLIY